MVVGSIRQMVFLSPENVNSVVSSLLFLFSCSSKAIVSEGYPVVLLCPITRLGNEKKSPYSAQTTLLDLVCIAKLHHVRSKGLLQKSSCIFAVQFLKVQAEWNSNKVNQCPDCHPKEVPANKAHGEPIPFVFVDSVDHKGKNRPNGYPKHQPTPRKDGEVKVSLTVLAVLEH